MKTWLAAPSLHIVLILAAYTALGNYLGVFAVVWSSPLFAALLARPVMRLASSFRQRIRAHVWLPVHGHHFVFRSTTILVIEDDDHSRWVCLTNVQTVVGATANERALSATYPGRIKRMGRPAQTYMRDDALVAHLGKDKALGTLKFRNWVDQSIRVPGQKVRRNLGIREVADVDGLR